MNKRVAAFLFGIASLILVVTTDVISGYIPTTIGRLDLSQYSSLKAVHFYSGTFLPISLIWVITATGIFTLFKLLKKHMHASRLLSFEVHYIVARALLGFIALAGYLFFVIVPIEKENGYIQAMLSIMDIYKSVYYGLMILSYIPIVVLFVFVFVKTIIIGVKNQVNSQ